MIITIKRETYAAIEAVSAAGLTGPLLVHADGSVDIFVDEEVYDRLMQISTDLDESLLAVCRGQNRAM